MKATSLLYLTSHEKEVSKTPTIIIMMNCFLTFCVLCTVYTSSSIDSHTQNHGHLVCIYNISFVHIPLCTICLDLVPPVPPSNVKTEKIDSGTKIRVSWDPLSPEQAWGFVTSYTVSYTKEGVSRRKRQTLDKAVPGRDTSTIIDGLDPSQDYSISVRADTKIGAGKPSEPISTKRKRFYSVCSSMIDLATSSAAPVSKNASRGIVNGGAIAGGLIAVVVALIVVVLLVLAAVFWIQRRARKNSNYAVFE